MVPTPDNTDARNQSSLTKYLRIGALAVTLFGLIEDPLVRLLILLAALLFAVQAMVMAICTAGLRTAGEGSSDGDARLTGGFVKHAAAGDRFDSGPYWN
jgi:hypothetical protein